MVIGIFGESCTGKTTLANILRKKTGAEVFSGKDYLRLAKSEGIAKKLFQKKLQEAMSGDHIIYVITEREHLDFLPERATRILVTADLHLIQERFSQRMQGDLPDPVRQMLERKHGCFDLVPHDYHVHNSSGIEEVTDRIQEALA